MRIVTPFCEVAARSRKACVCKLPVGCLHEGGASKAGTAALGADVPGILRIFSVFFVVCLGFIKIGSRIHFSAYNLF